MLAEQAFTMTASFDRLLYLCIVEDIQLINFAFKTGFVERTRKIMAFDVLRRSTGISWELLSIPQKMAMLPSRLLSQ